MKSISRRLFLQSTGIAIGLPMLESMLPAAPAAAPRRMICIGVPFGFEPSAFVPVTTGRDYALPSHLTHLLLYNHEILFVIEAHIDHLEKLLIRIKFYISEE